MLLNIILIIIGFVLLIKGADFLVDGASEIAKKFHIPEIVIGLTIVAIGTSMPELVVSVTSALEGHSDLAIGNVVGSNIANMFLILGVCAVIKPLIFKKETRLFEIPFTVFTTILLFFLCINGSNEQINTITREEGIILLVFCLLFIIYNLIMAKRGEEFDKEGIIEILEEKNDSSFEAFTPREVNPKNKAKIKELQEKRKTLQKKISEIEEKQKKNTAAMEELNAMLHYVKKEETLQKNKIENVSREKSEQLENIETELEAVLLKLKNSLQFIEVDQTRSKLELQQLIPQIENILQKINHSE